MKYKGSSKPKPRKNWGLVDSANARAENDRVVLLRKSKTGTGKDSLDYFFGADFVGPSEQPISQEDTYKITGNRDE